VIRVFLDGGLGEDDCLLVVAGVCPGEEDEEAEAEQDGVAIVSITFGAGCQGEFGFGGAPRNFGRRLGGVFGLEDFAVETVGARGRSGSRRDRVSGGGDKKQPARKQKAESRKQKF